MIVKVKFIPKEKEIREMELDHGSLGQNILEKLNLAYDAHIITRNGTPIPMDEELKDGDEIQIIQVISGG